MPRRRRLNPTSSGARAFQPIEPPRRRAARASLLALLGFVGLAALVPLARASFPGATALVPADLLPAEAVLCPLTGFAAWLVWRRVDVGLERKRAALRRWGWLLLLGALWPAVPGGAHAPAIAAALLAAAGAAAVATALSFRPIRLAAALLLLPYLAWLALATAGATTHF